MNAMTTTDPAMPLVLTLGSEPDLSTTVGELCAFLRLRVRRLERQAGLAEAVRAARPLCLLVTAPCATPETMAAVARADAALPVLMVAAGPLPEAGRLPNLLCLPRRPDLRMVVEFLFHAERQAGQAGLLPA